LKKLLFILPLLFVFSAFFLFSQEAETDNEDRSESEASDSVQLPNDDGLYVITAFEFDIKGRTRSSALLYKTELKTGEKFQGRTALDEFVSDKTQVLINQRVLKDNASITAEIGEQAADGSYPVTLILKTEDTWNVMAVPRPKYSSNSGLDITIKARDYNFMGSMNPLRVDLGYRYDEDGYSYFDFMLDSDTPFRLFGLNWNFNFDHDFSYRPKMDEPFYYKNTSGLSVEIPYKRTTFYTGVTETLTLNEENPRTYWYPFGYPYPRFQQGIYMSTTPFIAWGIPTGFHYYHLGEVTYTPLLSATFYHEFPQWPLHDFRKGPILSFSHSLSFGRVDWVNNFRKGVSASIANAYSFDFYYQSININPWGVYLGASVSGHKIVNEHFNFSTRASYRQWFLSNFTESGGDLVRGIIDDDIKADYMFAVNLDFTFRVFKFRPSEWFDKHKMRIINFDLQVSPFVDLALYNNPITQEPFGFENMLIGGGLEVIVYPLSFRSLFLRASAGLGIKTGDLQAGFSRELFIGTELHY
jgi:hypothetical protein